MHVDADDASMMPDTSVPDSPKVFSSHAALPNGTCLQEFEVTGVVGEGGFGIVYLAQDKQLHRTVAIKEYMPASLASRGDGESVVVRSERHQDTFEAGRRSFITEARMLAQFKHPALVEVFRFWEQNGTVYMAMPYYRGKTLREVLKNGAQIDERWIKSVLGPVMDALEMMHAQNVYHRDIAPDNVLILTTGAPVLLDLGAARRIISDLTQAVTVVLKPGYAPIEQYAEDTSIRQGPWTDIYALAAVIYFAITGKAPVASVSRIMKDTLVPLLASDYPGFSESFLAGLNHALAVKPEDRPQNITELRECLGVDSFVASTTMISFRGEGVSATPSTSAPIATEPARSESVAESIELPDLSKIPDMSEMSELSEKPAQPEQSSKSELPVKIEPLVSSDKATQFEPPTKPEASGQPEKSESPALSQTQGKPSSEKSEKLEKPKNLELLEKTLEKSPTFEKTRPHASPVILGSPADPDSTVVMRAVRTPRKHSEPSVAATTRRRFRPEFLFATGVLIVGALAVLSWNFWSGGPVAAVSKAQSEPLPSIAAESGPAVVAASSEPVIAVAQSRPVADVAAVVNSDEPQDSDKNKTSTEEAADNKIEAEKPVAVPQVKLKFVIHPWGEVWVDGEPKGASPPLKELTLPEGVYRIELRNPGFGSETKVISVRKGRAVVIEHYFQ